MTLSFYGKAFPDFWEFILTLERGLDVLLTFIAQPVSSVPEVAARTGMSKSATYRIVRSLKDRGFLSNTGSGNYRPGPRVLQLAEAARQAVIDVARPKMRELSQLTGETVLLTTLAGDQALAVAQVSAPQPIRLTFETGVARPLHAGASAKVLFAFLDGRQRERILARGGFDRRTENTVTDPQLLSQQLDQIRGQGWAMSTEEYETHVRAIAAPVFDAEGGVWGLSVVGPVFRLTDDLVGRTIAVVLAAADDLTHEAGGSRRQDRVVQPSLKEGVRV